MIFVNALDDPLMPFPLLEPVIKFCSSNPGFMFILTKHGGHLGFLEGSSLSPSSVTWLDRLIVQLANGVINMMQKQVQHEKSLLYRNRFLKNFHISERQTQQV
uniref:Uncharacterized protein n=1 Tax=Romanomermis culicivorax TaxID=13658 RepID=A0A915JRU5_ROMCU